MTSHNKLDYDVLSEQIAEQAAHLDAAHHRLLTNLRVFDDSGRWHDQGFRSCASWLSWRVGWTLGTAREHVRVANALGSLPAIDSALSRGELSYSKVRALTRVATPDNESVLLEQARMITGYQLEMLCRKYASVQRADEDARPEDLADRRYVSRRDTDDGMVAITALLPPDEAAVLWASIQKVTLERCRAARPAPDVASTDGSTPATSEDAPSRDVPSADVAVTDASRPVLDSARTRAPSGFDRADALMHIAHGIMCGDKPDRSPTELIISVPLETLQDASRVNPEDIACCSDGTPLSVHAARRLACDAGIVAMVEDANGNVLAMGRKRRTISGVMKRALLCRDKKCRFPGCTTTVFLEGHHGKHWLDGGETDLSNVIALCSYHHRFVHEYGFRIELGADNTVIAYDPQGKKVPDVPPPVGPQLADLGWPNIERGNAPFGITPCTIECWDGTPPDYAELVDWIVRSEEPPPAMHRGDDSAQRLDSIRIAMARRDCVAGGVPRVRS